MSSDPTPMVELSPVKRALLEIRELRARLAELESERTEAIAIVGMSIRAPGGVTDVDSFARMLWSGTDAITDIPADRWPLEQWYAEAQDAAGKMYTRVGGFVDKVDLFDAEFFGIAPVEAASMDPQQRMVLELSWHALEHAGHAPSSLAGTRAGVYLGISNSDYGRALFAHPELIDPYFSPGTAFSVAAGRVSYVLGLQGPAISVDTACSSSLVSLHLACQGLRLGECDLALAGGVNLILTPELNINFSKAGMMSRDGRCRTFDADAAGYVRGEGGGMVVLRRLRDALADGDRVLAVVRGSAVNQDGRSNGLTAPNGPSQEAVIRAALTNAGVLPSQVSYVEAHGTGTSLGDPIEVNALSAVLHEGRNPSAALTLGSVKTNIGHLEAAAGIAGVIKTVIALQRKEIPPNLHFSTPNPYIDWAAMSLQVPSSPTPWVPIDGRRVAGVSSFGFSGTNAHVILEAAPESDRARTDVMSPPMHVLTLSARDDTALRELAVSYHERLMTLDEGDFTALADFCFTANAGRSHHAHRMSVSGGSASSLEAGLDGIPVSRTGAAVRWHGPRAVRHRAGVPPRV
jgi:acyl transferase domain-containing protein